MALIYSLIWIICCSSNCSVCFKKLLKYVYCNEKWTHCLMVDCWQLVSFIPFFITYIPLLGKLKRKLPPLLPAEYSNNAGLCPCIWDLSICFHILTAIKTLASFLSLFSGAISDLLWKPSLISRDLGYRSDKPSIPSWCLSSLISLDLQTKAWVGVPPVFAEWP